MTLIIAQHKKTLSKLLALENINVQVDMSAPTAAFDIVNRNLVLPNWSGISEPLLDMLIVHEVGHALNTPGEKWLAAIDEMSKATGAKDPKAMIPVVQSYLNIVEDARIDKLQKRRYPGTKRDYLLGYRELNERDLFGIKKNGTDTKTLDFIDRMNIFFKGGSGYEFDFTAEEEGYIKEAELLETWEEVLALTKRIFEYAKVQNQIREQKSSGGDESDGEGDGQPVTGKGEKTGKGKMSKSPAPGSGQPGEEKEPTPSDQLNVPGQLFDAGDSMDDGEGETKSPAGKSDDAKEEVKAPDKSGEDAMPEAAKTADAMNDFAKSTVQPAKRPHVYFEIPELNLESIVDDYKVVLKDAQQYFKNYAGNKFSNLVADFKKQENVAISYMVKEFEMRKAADAYSRTKISKTGALNTNKLHSYSYNEDIFRRNQTVSTGKNHGFVMLLDWSGSMCSNLDATLKQLFSLTMFCRRIGVPFEVYSFRDMTSAENKGKTQFVYSTTNNNVTFGYFKMRNILSSRMKEYEMNESMKYLLSLSAGNSSNFDPMTSTPLNQALYVLDPLVAAFRKKTNVQVMNIIAMTDGGANGHSYDGPNNGSRRPAANIYGESSYIINDRKTGAQYDAGVNGRSSYSGTDIFTSILKNRTGANLINFDLVTSQPYALDEKQRKIWKKEGFYENTSTKTGFDVSFSIDAKNMTTDDTSLDDISTKGLGSRGLTTQIVKHLAKKSVSRVLLRRFIDNIIS